MHCDATNSRTLQVDGEDVTDVGSKKVVGTEGPGTGGSKGSGGGSTVIGDGGGRYREIGGRWTGK